MNVYVEVPSGARSRGYDCDAKSAPKILEQVAAQLRTWKNFTADVILTDDINDEIQREHIANA